MPKTTVKRMSAAELKKLYGGRTREENLTRMSSRIKQRFDEIRLIGGYVDTVLNAPQSTAVNQKEEEI